MLQQQNLGSIGHGDTTAKLKDSCVALNVKLQPDLHHSCMTCNASTRSLRSDGACGITQKPMAEQSLLSSAVNGHGETTTCASTYRGKLRLCQMQSDVKQEG